MIRRLCSAAVLAAALVLAPAAARAQLPSDARWRVFETPHFRVHYVAGLDSLAHAAADRAEVAYGEIRQALIRPPHGRINLLLADNVDYSNGYSTPFPTNRVVIYAHPPVDDPSLAFNDDWLELVLTHELVHTFQLDYVHGPLRSLRAVFGRLPLTFPETLTPGWTKEGLAVYLESRLTQSGRLRGTTHEMGIRTAVLEGRFFTLDRASGDPVRWPVGNTQYVYGSEFIQWLSDRYGPEKAGRFVRTYGGRIIPFTMDDAAKDAYGVSFSTAWRQWRAELERRYAVQADSLRAAGLTQPEVLTKGGRYTEFPRWSPDGRWIAYGTSTGREQASERVVGMDGGERVLASRTSLGGAAWTPDGAGVVTSMLELNGPFRIYGDLYRIGSDGGRERMTHGARLLDPDVAKDGRVVAVRSSRGMMWPVVLDAAGGAERDLVRPDSSAQWSFPRWSPDGRSVAISRWRPGGLYDVVVLDAASGRVTAQATSDRALDLHPTWSPDGRYILFSSDRTGIANLYAFDTNGQKVMQVTNVLTGAFEPDVSPDGRWIAFQLYKADGYHVARIPFDPASWRPAPPVRAAVSVTGTAAAPPRAAATPDRPYSPWRSLVPAAWSPTVASRTDLGTAIGAAVAGTDVVDRHSYAAFAQVYTDQARTEAGFGYLYRGLGEPTLGFSAFQDWDVLAHTPTLDGRAALLERERSASAVATFARPRFRSYAWLSLGANARDRVREWTDATVSVPGLVLDPPPEVGAIATLGVSTARAYDFSISTQDGAVAAASIEGRRFTRALEGETEKRGYMRMTGRAQAYHGIRASGFARHVVALRVIGGGETGSRSPGFTVGGIDGDALATPLGTGFGLSDTRELAVRGFPQASQVGDRAVAGTAEYRFPLALVERGLRLLPVNLDRLWGTAFADAGTAWCVEACDPFFAARFSEAKPLVSVGAELGTDLLLGFNAHMRLRAGVALPLSDVENDVGGFFRPSAKAYLTLGQSF